MCRYDKDGSGSIEIEEMVEIVGNLFELEGLSKVRSFEQFYIVAFDSDVLDYEKGSLLTIQCQVYFSSICYSILLFIYDVSFDNT